MSQALQQLIIQHRDALRAQFYCHDPRESSKVQDGTYIHLIEPVALQNRINRISRRPAEHDEGNKQILQQLLSPKPLRIAKIADVDALDTFALQNPHMASVINTLTLQAYQQAITAQPLHFDPILLISPPGLGKSWLTQQLSRILDLPYFEFQLSGSGDTLQLTGTSMQWGRAAPGELIQRMASCLIANPIIAMDELDKAGGTSWGQISDILLMLLEPENAARFEDKYIGLPARLDLPSYLLTANNLELISEPLRDRCNIQTLNLPSDQEQRWLLVRRLYSKMRTENKLADWFAEDLPDSLCDAFFVSECQSVREVQKRLTQGIALALQPSIVGRVVLAPEFKLLPLVPECQPETVRYRMGFIP